MKKTIAIIMAAAVAISGAGCTDRPAEENLADGLTQGENAALSGELAGEITVASYDSLYKDFLEHAARVFEETYPGTKVNVNTAVQMDMKSSESEGEQRMLLEAGGDTQGQMDYVTNVNTALMGGGGADIYAIDVLPYYKYAENGQLEDLEKYMDGDNNFQKSDYRVNVLDALKYKGGQYIFPLDYSFRYYEYDSTLFSEEATGRLQSAGQFSLDELFEIAEDSQAVNPTGRKIAGMKGYTHPNNGASVFSEEFLNNYNSFVDIQGKTANFTDGNFENLLEKIKLWETQGYIIPSGSADLSLEDFSASTSEQCHYKLKNNIELLLHELRTLEGWEINIPVAGVSPSTHENDTAAGLAKGADGSVMFEYSAAFGINSNSQNKTLAWEFIKFLASQEMQEALQLYPAGMMGLPVHNEARTTKAKDGVTGALFGLNDSSGSQDLSEAQQTALDSLTGTVELYSDMLNTYPVTDVTIAEITCAEVKLFFDGRVSAAEAANTIQNKVNRYLNE